MENPSVVFADEEALVIPPSSIRSVVDVPPSEEVVRNVNAFFAGAERKVKIVLEENENIPPTGQFIGVNGRGYMLRPGYVAEVPLSVINVLNDAVVSVPEVDPTTQQVVGYRDKLRFPYRIVP